MNARFYTPRDFNCIQCGKCCRKLDIGRIFKPGDVKRWIREKRQDILRYCKVIEFQGAIDLIDFFDPDSNKYVYTNCPFLVKRLGKYWCGIHETKPWTCENWPFTPANALNPENPLHVNSLHFHTEFSFCKAFDKK